jgi:hypothetical protein
LQFLQSARPLVFSAAAPFLSAPAEALQNFLLAFAEKYGLLSVGRGSQMGTDRHTPIHSSLIHPAYFPNFAAVSRPLIRTTGISGNVLADVSAHGPDCFAVATVLAQWQTGRVVLSASRGRQSVSSPDA